MSIREIDSTVKPLAKNTGIVNNSTDKVISLLFENKVADNPIDDVAKFSQRKDKDTIKLKVDNLKDPTPLKDKLIEIAKKAAICGAITFVLGGCIGAEFPLFFAGAIGGALGSALLFLHWKIEESININKLQTKFDRLTDEQKKTLNKEIEEDVAYAHNSIKSYIKKAERFIFDNKVGFKGALKAQD